MAYTDKLRVVYGDYTLGVHGEGFDYIFSEAQYNPVGSYIKYFDLDKNMCGKRIHICFEGVEEAMYLWLNGQFIGYAEDSFTPSEFDLTPYIKEKEYASSIGMSISWFIRSFKKYTGSTPIQFITSLRMTNAQVLLETTSYSINEIAGIVGYNNPLYFSRLFHKQKGCSPSEYRARNT
jgi:AraC-like DNA-binding protein